MYIYGIAHGYMQDRRQLFSVFLAARATVRRRSLTFSSKPGRFSRLEFPSCFYDTARSALHAFILVFGGGKRFLTVLFQSAGIPFVRRTEALKDKNITLSILFT